MSPDLKRALFSCFVYLSEVGDVVRLSVSLALAGLTVSLKVRKEKEWAGVRVFEINEALEAIL